MAPSDDLRPSRKRLWITLAAIAGAIAIAGGIYAYWRLRRHRIEYRVNGDSSCRVGVLVVSPFAAYGRHDQLTLPWTGPALSLRRGASLGFIATAPGDHCPKLQCQILVDGEEVVHAEAMAGPDTVSVSCNSEL